MFMRSAVVHVALLLPPPRSTHILVLFSRFPLLFGRSQITIIIVDGRKNENISKLFSYFFFISRSLSLPCQKFQNSLKQVSSRSEFGTSKAREKTHRPRTRAHHIITNVRTCEEKRESSEEKRRKKVLISAC